MASKSQRSKLLPLLAIALGGGAVFAGTSLYVQSAPKVQPRRAAMPDVQVEAKQQPGTVQVMEPSYDNAGELNLEPRSVRVKEGSEAKAVAIAAYIAKIPAVPSNTRVLSVKLDGRTAVVDFSKELDSGYGTEDEKTLIQGVLATMGQFPDVDKVEFRIEGKPTQGIGNLDLSSPLAVIRVPKEKP